MQPQGLLGSATVAQFTSESLIPFGRMGIWEEYLEQVTQPVKKLAEALLNTDLDAQISVRPYRRPLSFAPTTSVVTQLERVATAGPQWDSGTPPHPTP